VEQFHVFFQFLFVFFFFFVTGKVESHVHGLGLSSGGVMYIWSSPFTYVFSVTYIGNS